ncbi:hypothetical protein Tco_0720617 [Tanacetum coccineum]
MSFSKHFDTGPVYYTKPLDSLKHLNDHFFWVDASVFPIPIPWHNNKTLRKNPHPLPTEFNADVCHYLSTNPAPFKKFLEPFLCFISISRYYELDVNCYPTFLTDDDEGGCSLFTSFTYFLATGKQKLDGEVPLLDLTRGRVVPLPSVNDQGDADVQGVGDDDVNEESGDAAGADHVEENDHAIQDEGANIVHIEDEVPAFVVERAKGSWKKRKATGRSSGFGLPPKKLRANHGTSDAGESTGGKSVAAL